MERHWTELMDIGIVHFMIYPVIKDDNPELTIQTAETIAKDPFFNVLEVRRSEYPGVHEKLAEIAEVSGLNIGIGAQPGLLLNKLSLNDPDEAGRQAAIAEVKKSVDAAYEVGARMAACLSGPDVDDDNIFEGNQENRQENGDLAIPNEAIPVPE